MFGRHLGFKAEGEVGKKTKFVPRGVGGKGVEKNQGHPTDCFGRISVRKTCNRLKFSVREMSSRAVLIKIN